MTNVSLSLWLAWAMQQTYQLQNQMAFIFYGTVQIFHDTILASPLVTLSSSLKDLWYTTILLEYNTLKGVFQIGG